jgi:outer membrane protein assembly factor BamB
VNPRSWLVAAVLFLGGPASAEDWPGWRGPRADGTVTDKGYPLTWTATENVRWKLDLPGTGHASPVVSKGKVFVTGCVEADKTRALYCADRRTGKLLWEKAVVVSNLEKKHIENSWASSTPAADGERVYVTFLDQPQLRVYCYDYEGKLLWEKNPGEFHSVHGFSSPPLVYKDLVIVNGDQDAPAGQKAFIVAFDKKTGAEKWRIDRPNKLRSYCPPVVVEAAGKTQMVLTGSKCVASYDPDTGKQYWIIDGPTEQFVSSMVLHDGVLLLTAGFPVHWVMAIKPDGSGNVTKTHVLWSKKGEGGYVPSPVADRGKLYLADDQGVASCWDVKTGRLYWKERLSGKGHHASAVAADGRIYLTADDGTTFVLKAAEEFEILAKNPLGERVFSSPAFSDGDIFIRGAKHLWCVGAKKDETGTDPAPVVKGKFGTYTIGKGTTYVLGPKDAGGSIDYPAAINERQSKGVTPENNANVAIWKILGPNPVGVTAVSGEYFEKLGMKPPPANGEYFVSLDRYAEKHFKGTPAEAEARAEVLSALAQRAWTAKENPSISAWLKANHRPLDALVEATKRTHYFNPLVPRKDEKEVSLGIISAPLPGVTAARGMAAALTARATLAVGEGNADAAWRDLLACHRLARLVGRGSCLIEGLVGVAIDNIAFQADLVFLDGLNPDAKCLEVCLRDLRALPPPPNAGEKMDLSERCSILELFTTMSRDGAAALARWSGEPGDNFALTDLVYKDPDWDVALKLANGWFDRFVAAAAEPDIPERYRKLDELETELRALGKVGKDPTRLARLKLAGGLNERTKGQVLGEVFVPLMMPAVTKVIQAADRCRQTQENVTVAFALAGYHRDNGKYPKSLDLLAPKHLARVPTDAFSGNALIYKPQEAGYLLYSVGVNGRDDNGRGATDQPAGDDLVIRIPLPAKP